MATVDLARDFRQERKVALKVLNPELGAALGVARFLAEIKVTANLQHPNLLSLFDSGDQFTMRLAAVSPDGKWLAYTSNESGVGAVFVRALNKTIYYRAEGHIIAASIAV